MIKTALGFFFFFSFCFLGIKVDLQIENPPKIVTVKLPKIDLQIENPPKIGFRKRDSSSESKTFGIAEAENLESWEAISMGNG